MARSRMHNRNLYQREIYRDILDRVTQVRAESTIGWYDTVETVVTVTASGPGQEILKLDPSRIWFSVWRTSGGIGGQLWFSVRQPVTQLIGIPHATALGTPFERRWEDHGPFAQMSWYCITDIPPVDIVIQELFLRRGPK